MSPENRWLYSLLKWSLFTGHVSFQGCIHFFFPLQTHEAFEIFGDGISPSRSAELESGENLDLLLSGLQRSIDQPWWQPLGSPADFVPGKERYNFFIFATKIDGAQRLFFFVAIWKILVVFFLFLNGDCEEQYGASVCGDSDSILHLAKHAAPWFEVPDIPLNTGWLIGILVSWLMK